MGFVERSFRGMMGRSGQTAAGRGGKQKERKGRGALSTAALAGARGLNRIWWRPGCQQTRTQQ